MPRVRIIKKNDEYSSEYDLGDIFEIRMQNCPVQYLEFIKIKTVHS